MTWVCSDCPRGDHVIRLGSPVHSVDRLVTHLSVTTETAVVVVVVAGVPRVELDQCTHLEHTPFPDTSRLPGVNCNEQRNRRHIHRLHRRFFFFFEKGGGVFWETHLLWTEQGLMLQEIAWDSPSLVMSLVWSISQSNRRQSSWFHIPDRHLIRRDWCRFRQQGFQCWQVWTFGLIRYRS